MKVFTFKPGYAPVVWERPQGGPAAASQVKMDAGVPVLDIVEIEKLKKVCEAAVIKGTPVKWNGCEATVTEAEGEGVHLVFIHSVFPDGRMEIY
jgi:hypothetical protein